MDDTIQSMGRIRDAELWSVDLDAPAQRPRPECLSDDERARAARFVFPLDRTRYENAHRALRHVLARCTGEAPERLRFSVGAFGKPRLAGDGAPAFNLSHSQGLALIAIGPTAMGVDVELPRPLADWRALASHHCTDAEQRFIAQQPAAQQTPAFLRCWTRKEACLKALGVGLSMDACAIDVALDIPDPGVARVQAGSLGMLAVRSLAVGAQGVAALAFVEADSVARQAPAPIGAFA